MCHALTAQDGVMRAWHKRERVGRSRLPRSLLLLVVLAIYHLFHRYYNSCVLL
jgi:cell division protein FtsB